VQIHPEKGFSLETPIREGWFLTEDLGEVIGDNVVIHGRLHERVKILGELVSLVRVEDELKTFLTNKFCVLSIPDERKGQALIAVIKGPTSYASLKKNIEAYQKQALALTRLDHWYVVDDLPLSALGKVKKAQLLSYLGF